MLLTVLQFIVSMVSVLVCAFMAGHADRGGNQGIAFGFGACAAASTLIVVTIFVGVLS